MAHKLNLINQTFGHLTVLREDTENSGKGTRWICRCQCGREKSFRSSRLRNGESKSCGLCEISSGRPGTKKFLTFAHKTASLQGWSEITGISYHTLADRYAKGWTVEEILFTRLRPGRVKFKPEDGE